MTHPLFDLSGRVALVSGAAQGMGRAMAIGFAEAGADVMICDINSEGIQATADHIQKLGRRAVPVTCDITNIEQIRAMFTQLDRDFGKIDILGNVAQIRALTAAGYAGPISYEPFAPSVHDMADPALALAASTTFIRAGVEA